MVPDGFHVCFDIFTLPTCATHVTPWHPSFDFQLFCPGKNLKWSQNTSGIASVRLHRKRICDYGAPLLLLLSLGLENWEIYGHIVRCILLQHKRRNMITVDQFTQRSIIKYTMLLCVRNLKAKVDRGITLR